MTPPALQVLEGLPPHLRADAARIYWQAFGAKLGRVLGPEARALAYLARVIDPRHAIAALSPAGALLGVAGFKTAEGAFADGDLKDLAAGYGAFGGLWRAGALRLLSREVDNRRFLIDGICVAEGARGQGVGSALLRGLAQAALRRGYHELRLEVTEPNLRARALYERHGYRAIRTDRLGPLRHVFGFDAAVVMVCPVALR